MFGIVHSNNYFGLVKIFVWSPFKMAVNLKKRFKIPQ